MLGLGLEEIILVIIVNHIRESAIVSSRISPIVFLQIRLKFTSDRDGFLVEVYILLTLVLFKPCERGDNLGNK